MTFALPQPKRPLTNPTTQQVNDIDWVKASYFLLMQASCLLCFWTGISATAIVIAVWLYVLRMFCLTGFLHRYFSHRAFKTSRLTQFLFAWLCCTLGQQGVIWWSAQHRHHHRHSDDPQDHHSPHQHSFFESYMGWIFREESSRFRPKYVRDWLRYPELVWLEDRHLLPGVVGISLLFLLGQQLGAIAPELHTNGGQMLWAVAISSTAIYHIIYSLNVATHSWGSRRFDTKDHSRNNAVLSLISLGESWHNNHHWYPASASQGLVWWEIDLTFYGLKLLEALGVIWDLRTYPKEWRSQAK